VKKSNASFIGGDLNNMLQQNGDVDEIGPSKPIIKIAKKTISLLGFIFGIDSQVYGASFWNSLCQEGLPYVNTQQINDVKTPNPLG
jgi:hypothetical protein